MKRFWAYLTNALTEDDLFVRVLFLLLGIGVASLGIWSLAWLLSNDTSSESIWFRIIMWCFALFFSLWGALVFSRCWAPPQSTVARYAEKFAPDSADEGALVLLVVFGLPAVIVTLLLRTLGLHGSSTRGG